MAKSIKYLPYGKWTCADGREILFNRWYQPLWQKHRGRVTPADPNEWIDYTRQDYFYDDGTPRRGLRVRLRRILDEFRGVSR